MHSREQCPVILLHRVHRDAGFKPIIRRRLAEFFTSATQGQGASSSSQCHPADLQRLQFEPDPFSPRLSTVDGSVSISLHLTRVQLGYDRRSGCPLLACETPQGDCDIWLVVILADMPQALNMVEMLSRFGTIRSDFHDHYKLQGSHLGEGGFAHVYGIASLAEAEQGTRQIVGKVTKTSLSISPLTTQRQVLREASVLAVVQGHPNVVELHGLFELVDASGPRWVLTMERCPNGDLFSAVSKQTFSEHKARQILMGLASALSHVHSHRIVHRDVKPENILLDSDGQPVLADFGLATHVSDERTMASHGGTPGYTAPEIVTSSSYGCKADCFSAGCVLHFLFCGSHPHPGNEVAEVLRRTVHCATILDDANFAGVSASCKDLMLKLLRKDADSRLAMDEALAHAWMAQDADSTMRQSHREESENPRSRVWTAFFSLPRKVAAARKHIWSKSHTPDESLDISNRRKSWSISFKQSPTGKAEPHQPPIRPGFPTTQSSVADACKYEDTRLVDASPIRSSTQKSPSTSRNCAKHAHEKLVFADDLLGKPSSYRSRSAKAQLPKRCPSSAWGSVLPSEASMPDASEEKRKSERDDLHERVGRRSKPGAGSDGRGGTWKRLCGRLRSRRARVACED